jgi:hypothetical protein
MNAIWLAKKTVLSYNNYLKNILETLILYVVA